MPRQKKHFTITVIKEEFTPTLTHGNRLYKDEGSKKESFIKVTLRIKKNSNEYDKIKLNFDLYYSQPSDSSFKKIDDKYHTDLEINLKDINNNSFDKNTKINIKDNSKLIYIYYRFINNDFHQRTKYKLKIFNKNLFKELFLQEFVVWSKRKLSLNKRTMIKEKLLEEEKEFFKKNKRNPNSEELNFIKNKVGDMLKKNDLFNSKDITNKRKRYIENLNDDNKKMKIQKKIEIETRKRIAKFVLKIIDEKFKQIVKKKLEEIIEKKLQKIVEKKLETYVDKKYTNLFKNIIDINKRIFDIEERKFMTSIQMNSEQQLENIFSDISSSGFGLEDNLLFSSAYPDFAGI